ncbi:MAG: 50S ribosomal protein L21 [Candidatus Xenobiia bacterium LiM19]
MYAVIETGGKQLKVSPGDRVRVEKLDVEKGNSVRIDKVLLLTSPNDEITVGTPYVEGATVDGNVLRHAKAKKVTIFKYKPKKRIRKKTGHRQEYTLLEIDEVRIGDTVIGKKEDAKPKEPSVKKEVSSEAKSGEKKEAKKLTKKASLEKKEPKKKS